MVQRRAARWVLGIKDKDQSITNMLWKLNWRSLAQRRADARLNLMYKIVYGLVNNDGSKYFKLQRDGIKIQPIYGRTKYHESGYFPRTIRVWNSLPIHILSADTLIKFKTEGCKYTLAL